MDGSRQQCRWIEVRGRQVGCSRLPGTAQLLHHHGHRWLAVGRAERRAAAAVRGRRPVHAHQLRVGQPAIRDSLTGIRAITAPAYAASVHSQGLVLMDTPGYDPVLATGETRPGRQRIRALAARRGDVTKPRR
ncbi:hypothetical protein C8241_07950 [Paracidovorax avenae]|nr:hypothetical protein C8241_07950 [Paracidovorax avenae]